MLYTIISKIDFTLPCPKVTVTDKLTDMTGMMTRGVIAKITKDVYLQIGWERADNGENPLPFMRFPRPVIYITFIDVKSNNYKLIGNLPEIDFDKSEISGIGPIDQDSNNALYLAYKEFMTSHATVCNSLNNKKLIPKEKLTVKLNPKNVYIIIDGIDLYLSDPKNTPFQLWTEQCIYEMNGRSFEVFDKNNERWDRLVMSGNLETITLK